MVHGSYVLGRSLDFSGAMRVILPVSYDDGNCTKDRKYGMTDSRSVKGGGAKAATCKAPNYKTANYETETQSCGVDFRASGAKARVSGCCIRRG
jgi:hypothetical protein